MYSDAELNAILEEEDLWLRPAPAAPESPLSRFRPRRQPPPENVERLGYALDVALRAYRRLLRESFAELGVHPAQESLLTEIYFAEGARTEGDFARRLGCSRQTVARSIQRLCGAGFLEISRHHQDGRMNLVQLTPLGERVLRVVGNALRMVEAELAERLDEADHLALHRMLEEFPDCVERTLQARFKPVPPP